MNEKIFNILNEIDVVQESALDTQLAVLNACDSAYTKYCMISESYEGDVDELGLFTEGAIGDEMKKMKGKNENAAVSILMALPRFIAALFKVITKKNEKTEENLKEIANKKNEGKIAEIVKGIISEQDGAKQKTMIEKIVNVIYGASIVVVAGTGIPGLVFHIKPKKKEAANGELLKTSVTADGFEFCITEKGTIAMTKEFEDKYDEITKDLRSIRDKVENGNYTKEDADKYRELLNKFSSMNAACTKYDGENAKELKLTGLYDWYNRSNALMISIKDMADKLGKAAIDKAGDNKITSTAAKAFDHVIRAAGAFVQNVIWLLGLLGTTLMTLIKTGYDVIKNLVTKNPIIKKEEKEAKEKADKEKAAEKKDDKDAAEAEDADKSEKIEESSVEEVPEGEKVTQESVTETEPVEESEPESTDPVASAWYSR